ncbi:MAG: hypothetical protein WC865_07270 [Bacteroidales bacterium]
MGKQNRRDFIWSVASNVLANQHGNINRAGRILEDENLVDYIVVQDQYRETRFPNLPPFDQFVESNQGVYSVPVHNPQISLEEFRRDEIPAVPKYIQEWESPFGPEAGSGELGASIINREEVKDEQ